MNPNDAMTIPAGENRNALSIREHVHLIIAVLGLWHLHLQLHETTLVKMKTE